MKSNDNIEYNCMKTYIYIYISVLKITINIKYVYQFAIKIRNMILCILPHWKERLFKIQGKTRVGLLFLECEIINK